MSRKIYTSSLADCQAFANLFSNTCLTNTIAANVASLPSSEVSCLVTGPYCTDSGIREADTEKCVFERKLCAQCTGGDVITNQDGSTSASVVEIRIQSNGLPKNCFYGFSEIKEQQIDFTTVWNQGVNLDPESNVVNKVTFSASGNDEFSDILCKPNLISNSDSSGLQIAAGANAMDHVVGITIDGVLMLPNLEELVLSGTATGTYVDTWFPNSQIYSNWKEGYPNVAEVDNCLGSVSKDGEYFFRSASQCVQGGAANIVEDTGVICDKCFDKVENVSKMDDVLKAVPQDVIGLAKDGRVIYGPMKIGQTNVAYSPCDIDACNGLVETVDNVKVYTYHASYFHPYLPACFGPGDQNGAANFG